MSRPRRTDRHLPPCVYHRHGAYWYVKRGKWTKIGSTLHEALTAYAEMLAEPTDGLPALIDRVLAQVRPSIEPSTYRQYRTAARKLKVVLAEFRPEDLRPKHVAALRMNMADTPNMANRCLSFLRIVYNHALDWQIVEVNPCLGAKRHEERKRGRYITDAEYRAVYAKAGPRLQIIMDLLYLTAQRVVDVLSIRRADLTDEGIRFEQQKTGSRLVVAWTPGLEAAVERAKGLRGPVTAMTLLHGRKGKPPDYRTVSKQWRDACDEAGIEDAQLRDLRAKSLTDAKRQGLDATALAGHSSAQMTDRYIRQKEIPVVSGPSFGQVLENWTFSPEKTKT